MCQIVHNAHQSVKAKRTLVPCIMHNMKYDDRPLPAQRLEQARKHAKFRTAKDAAIRFGWSYDSYHQHENGTRGIVRAAGKYAKAFKVSEGWLLTGEGAGPGEIQWESFDQQVAEIQLERPDLADITRQGIQDLIDTTRRVKDAYERPAPKKP